LAKHLNITGLVQGVGYRASFAARARALKLSGWVRNRADGSVEALVQGDAAAQRALVEWARRGPALARVDAVIVTDVDDMQLKDGEFDVLV